MNTPTREELIRLREDEELTREQIAAYYSVSLTTVRRWIKEMQVPRPTKQARLNKNSHLSRYGEIISDPGDGLTLMDRVRANLGDRLTEKRGVGYFLDGRHVSTAKIVAAAGLKFKDEE